MDQLKNIKNILQDFSRKADLFLLGVCLICSTFGLIVIKSATMSFASRTFIPVQLLGIVLGLVFYVVFTVIDLDVYADKWVLLAGFEFVFQGTLIVFGVDGGTGNSAWLRFGPIGVQPAEISKIIFIVLMAKQMTYLKEYKDISSVSSMLQLVAHFGVTFVWLMITADDLGSAVVFIGIFGIMLIAAGVKIYWFLLAGAAVALATPVLWNVFLDDYQRQRILAPYDPTVDPDGWGIRWHANQSKIALASGQLTGVGYGKGIQTQSEALSGKHTDFIFSSAGEELGMIACVAILILLSIVIIRVMVIGLRSNNTMSFLVCTGIAASFFVQLLINTGMCMEITPVIGITLPFFSYGGTSVMTSFAAVGIVSGIKYRPKPGRFIRGS